MTPFKEAFGRLGPAGKLLLPAGLWAALWLSLNPGGAKEIFSPDSATGFFNGIRAILPFAAGALGILIVMSKWPQQRPFGFLFLGPLGLAAAYGLVGIVSSLVLSPDASLSLYWAGAYLSVPIVLWAVVWGNDALRLLQELIGFTWLLVILLAVTLFSVALIYLDLGAVILDPSTWSRCRLNRPWLEMTHEVIRSTGVGRLAAIASIIAISGLCSAGKWRLLWLPLLLVFLILLVTSNARTAMVGLGAAGAFVILLNGGRKAAVAGVLALAIVGPLVWFTDVGQDFLRNCIFHNPLPPTASETAPRLTVPGGERDPETALRLTDPGGERDPETAPRLTVPEGERDPETAPRLTVPEGERALETAPRLTVPEGERALEKEPGLGALADPLLPSRIPEGFFTLTGRTSVWSAGWSYIKDSPFLGHGFQSDRLLLNTHMHNAPLHALIQTGFIGALPFMAALLFAWVLLFRALRNLNALAVRHKHMVIQAAGLLLFLTLRGIPESTGAFFGIDWLLLGPIFLYLQAVNRSLDLQDGAVTAS